MADNAGESTTKVVDLISKFLTPTAWIAGIVGLIGLAGLAFNSFLSLLVGAQVANYSSTAEHFGAGASLLFPGLIYTIDLIVAIFYVVLVLIGSWVLIVFLVRIAFLAGYALLLLAAWLVRRAEDRGFGPWIDSSEMERAAQKLTEDTPLVLHWSQGMHKTVRRAFAWTWRRFAWVFTFTFLVFAACFLTIWIPYTEAHRYRYELCQAAEVSLTPPGQNPGSGCDRLQARKGNAVARVSHPYPPIGQGSFLCALDGAAGAPAGPQPEHGEFKVPALNFLATEPKELLSNFTLGDWFGGGAHQLDCGVNWIQARISIDSLLSRPKLVAVALGDKGEVLRPMLSVADYGDAVVLYDFLFDGKTGDEYLYPLRALKRSDIHNITAIDPAGRLTNNELPILAVLDTACGRNPVEDFEVTQTDPDDVKEVKDKIKKNCDFATSVGARDCIKRQFIKVDSLICRANELPASPDPKPILPPTKADADALAHVLAAVDLMAARLVAIQSGIEAIKVAVSDSDPDQLLKEIGGLAAILQRVDGQLTGLAAGFAEAQLAEIAPGINRVEDGISRLQAEAALHGSALGEAKGEIAASLSAIGASILELHGKLEELGRGTSEHQALSASVDRVLQALDQISNELAQAEVLLRTAIEHGINVTVTGSPTPPPTDVNAGPSVARPPVSDMLLFGAPDESLISADTKNCEHLSQWDSTRNGLEFENAKHRLSGRRSNDLVLRTGSGRSDPWDRLLEIFSTWSNEIAEIKSLHSNGEIFLLLTGRASEKGAVGYNLDLSRQRAGEVERELKNFWLKEGIAPVRTLAVGQGEPARADRGSSANSDSSYRRVDASVCFTAASSEAAKATTEPDPALAPQ